MLYALRHILLLLSLEMLGYCAFGITAIINNLRIMQAFMPHKSCSDSRTGCHGHRDDLRIPGSFLYSLLHCVPPLSDHNRIAYIQEVRACNGEHVCHYDMRMDDMLHG